MKRSDEGVPQADRAESRNALVVWILIFRSALVLGLGLAFLLSGTDHPILGNLLATFWLAGAILTLRWARKNWDAAGSKLALCAGVAGLAAAVVVLSRFLIEGVVSVDAALTALGISAVFVGALRLLGAFRDEADDRPRSLRAILLGVSEIALGVVWIAVDDVSRTVGVVAGVWALLGGAIMLLDALDLRRQ